MDALEELGTETGGVANPMVEMKIHSRKGHVVSSSGSDDALDVDRAGEDAAEEEKKEGLLDISDQLDAAGSGDEEETPEYEPSQLVFAMLRSSEFVGLRSVPGVSTRKWKWNVTMFITIIFQILILLALAISSAFSYCTGPSDCLLGQVCVEFRGHLPTCEDCHFVSTLTPRRPVAGAYIGPFANVSRYCQAMLDGELDDTENRMGYLGISRYGETCPYIKEYMKRSGVLDRIVRVGAFALLSLMIAKERNRQCVGNYVRRQLHPLSVLLSDVSSGKSIDKVRLIKALLWKLQAILLDKVLLTILPYCMIALLATSGFGALETVLNGLSIGFVLELDTLSMAVFLDQRITMETKAQLNKIMQENPDKNFTIQCKRKCLLRGLAAFIYLNVTLESLHKYGTCEDVTLQPYTNAVFALLPLGILAEELLAPSPLPNAATLSSSEKVKAMSWRSLEIVVEFVAAVFFLSGFQRFADTLFYNN
jgi:hypothetical protein